MLVARANSSATVMRKFETEKLIGAVLLGILAEIIILILYRGIVLF